MSAPDGLIAWFNTTAAKLWGREPKIGSPDDRFCGSFRLYLPDGTFMAHSATPIADALINGTHYHGEDVIIERPDGSRITVCVFIDPVRDENDVIVGVTNFFYDVTDRKARELHIKHQSELLEAAMLRGSASEEALRKSEQALREADRRKDEFIAMLAHELRNPLAPLANASALLSRLTPDDTRVQSSIGVIERQVTQLTRLVDDLLDVGRITQSRIELKLKPANLADIVAQAVETVESQIRLKHHHVSIVESDEALFVNADFVRLIQCVGNVLNNAVKYTDEGGQIQVQLRADRSDAVIEITDSGMGIPSEVLPTIFDLFAQSRRAIDRASGGLGIGLAVVKRLIAMHDGSISARSGGADSGSVFEIRLPRIDRPILAVMEGLRSAVKPQRVLIVDDNVDAADSLAALLKADSHELRVTYNSKQALDCVEEFGPDVALIDLGLPGMNGYELAMRLRAMPQLNGLHLVAVTGYGQADDRAQTLQAGFDDHLVKPVDLSLLERTLVGVATGRHRNHQVAGSAV